MAVKKRTPKVALVPSAFIPKVAEQLDVNYKQLAEALGLPNEKVLYNCVSKKTCPRWLELAARQLVAQAKKAGGKGRPKNMKMVVLQTPKECWDALVPILAMMGSRVQDLDG